MSDSSQQIYDAFIVGCGPAGLTAAIYIARACLSVAIIEKEYQGGKLTKTLSIENYPGYMNNSGQELGDIMVQQTIDNGVVHYDGDVIDIEKDGDIWFIRTKKTVYKSKTVLIATGTKEKVLGIKNEKEYYGKGVSYCAICDGNLYRNKDVVVVGGGNSAAEEALYLSKLVNKVHLVHRRNEFRADKIMMKHIYNTPNIILHTPNLPYEVYVEDDEVVGLKVQHAETKKISLIKGKCIFFYIGLLPEIYFLKNLKINKDDNGFIDVDNSMQTNIPGMFAAGDVIKKNLRQVVTALNDGAIAAISIKNYINDKFPSSH